MSGVVLPGSIPGLLRRGSPVVVDADRWETRHSWGVVTHAYADAVYVVAAPESELDGCGEHVEVYAKVCALDLSDATGRAHAAWWLAEQHIGGPVRGGALFEMTTDGPLLTLHCSSSVLNMWGDSCAHLDPNDPRTLPDGSRWVDAEALRLVVLHVAEVTP